MAILIDVGSCGEIFWVATDVDSVGWLVHSDIIHAHQCRECEVLQVNSAEIFRHAQVHDEILRRDDENIHPS